MKRSTPLRRRTPIKKSRRPRRRPVDPGPRPRPSWAGGTDPEAWAAWEELRERVFARAGGRCEGGVTDQCRERRGDFARLGGHQAHHRLLRSRGGPDAIENLVALCGYCHEWVHAHPTKATALGLMVPSGADPAVRGVILADGRIVALTRDGGYLPDSAVAS